MRGKNGVGPDYGGFSVVAVLFFGEKEVARYPTREQAEWRAKELNEWAERSPRGYLQYYVRPTRWGGGGRPR